MPQCPSVFEEFFRSEFIYSIIWGIGFKLPTRREVGSGGGGEVASWEVVSGGGGECVEGLAYGAVLSL